MGSVTFGFKKKRSGRLDRRWDFDAQGAITSAPLVADVDGDGKKEIVFGTKKGKLFVLDLDAGIKWFYDTNDKMDEVELMFLDTEEASSIGAPPNIGDLDGDGKHELVFGTERGVVHALDSNGKERWRFKVDGAIRGQVLVFDLFEDNDLKVIFGSEDGKLYALNSKGKKVWSFDAGSPIQSTPGILHKGSPKIVFGCNDGSIFCVNNKGDLVWKFKTNASVLAQPSFGKVVNEDRLFVAIGSSDNHMYMLDDAGELLWKYKTEGAIVAKAAIDDINGDNKPEIVFGSCDNSIYALTHEGDKLWSYETDFWIVTEPIIEDLDNDGKKEIIVGSYDHNIYVLDCEGSYVLDYVPGLSGIVQQAGHYSDIITKEPGKTAGKKIWQYKTDGIIVGCAFIPENKSIVASTKPGRVNNIFHKDE
jgi:outer membrane protein assembly factor BamB